ncbi:MAG TPA: peptidoglycan DD-metalloendopeptidase family protein [Rhodothermales bacterium]|nr:peptidoglycan DD-metalloendopeptidase family protein [Rhodothermales bacterium]
MVNWFLLVLLGLSAYNYFGSAVPAMNFHVGIEQDTLRQELDALEESIESIREKEHKQWKKLQQKDQKLYQREQQITAYAARLTRLYVQQDSLQNSISQLRLFLKEQSQFTQKRAIYLYKYGRQHELLLLFSARSVNELLIRLYYFRLIKEQRDERISAYIHTQEKLANQLRNSTLLVERTQQLLKEAERYHQQINSEIGQAAKTLNTIQYERLALENTASMKRLYVEGLKRQVQTLSINNQNATEAYNQNLPPFSVSEILSGTLKPKSDPNGVGILIASPPETVVRAALGGLVKEVFSQPGYGECVVIETNGYSLVYGNLSTITLRPGQQIQKGSLIGTSGKENQPLGNALFLAVFKGRQALSPIAWLQ